MILEKKNNYASQVVMELDELNPQFDRTYGLKSHNQNPFGIRNYGHI